MSRGGLDVASILTSVLGRLTLSEGQRLKVSDGKAVIAQYQ